MKHYLISSLLALTLSVLPLKAEGLPNLIGQTGGIYLGHVSNLITLIDIVKEGKAKKRNERQLNALAAQDRQIGEYHSKRIKDNAFTAFQEDAISSREMMAEFTRATQVKQYYDKRADQLGVLARREGRLTSMIIKKVTPLILSQVSKTSKGIKMLQRVDRTFKDFDGKIDTLIKKTIELQAGLDKGNILSKSKDLAEKLSTIRHQIRVAQNAMQALGIRNPKIEKVLDKAQEIATAGIKATDDVSKAINKVTGGLPDKLEKLVEQLKQTKEDLIAEGEKIQNTPKNLRPHASPVKNIEKIVEGDKVYQDRKKEGVKAFTPREEASDEERSDALGQRLNNLEQEYKDSTDLEERNRIGYEMTLINKRLDEYKNKFEEKQKAKEEEERVIIICGTNEEKNAQGVCVCMSGFEPTSSGQCLIICGADEQRDDSGNCHCISGYTRINGECMPPCENNKIRDKSGICVCKKGYRSLNSYCIKTCSTDHDCPNLSDTCSMSGICVASSKQGYDDRVWEDRESDREEKVGDKYAQDIQKDLLDRYNEDDMQKDREDRIAELTKHNSQGDNDKKNQNSDTTTEPKTSKPSKATKSKLKYYVVTEKSYLLNRTSTCNTATYTIVGPIDVKGINDYVKEQNKSAQKKKSKYGYPIYKKISVSKDKGSATKPAKKTILNKCVPCPSGQHIGLDKDKQKCHGESSSSKLSAEAIERLKKFGAASQKGSW